MCNLDTKAPRVAMKFASSSSAANSKASQPSRRSNVHGFGGKRHKANSSFETDTEDSGSDDKFERLEGREDAITAYGPDGASNDDGDDEHKRCRRREEEDGRRARSGSSRRYFDSLGSPSPDRGNKNGHSSGRKRVWSRNSTGDEEVENSDRDKKAVKYGLTILKKGKPGERSDQYSKHPGAQSPEQYKECPSAPKTVDEEALDALFENGLKERKHDAASSATADDSDTAAQQEDYRRLPVEDFGASLLRGFGWDGKSRAKVKEVVYRRPNLTGLGARGIKGAEDLATWNPKSGMKEGSLREARKPRLSEYRGEEERKRRRIEEKYGESSYKRNRERERGRERDRR